MKHIFKGIASALIAGALLLVSNATTAFSQDTTKPTLSITNIHSGQRWTNEMFTVRGRAADNAGVSNVFYSLNAAAWTNAATANGWTNWSAEINLLPGTNTIAACAVDLSGNRSLTNTVRLVYYLTDVLTVRTNGTGKISITPAYDGAQLQIGANYSITANSTVSGYGLVRWTDGDDNILTNKATLKFMMASNLTLTANYGDIGRPTLSITNIKSGQRWSNDVFTVRGTAADNVGVSNVVYSLNQATWTNAAPASGWTNWSAEINLLPGTNIIAACAVDAEGNRSLTNTVRLVYYLTDVLTVRTNGTGKISITPAYDGAQLQIGANYSITANSAVSGYGLVRWTDGDDNILTNKATLKFMMASNLTLTANYGDVARPVVRVISTATNATGDSNVLLLSGTASDNLGVSNVFYRMDNGAWQSAPTTNHWTNWTATVNMNPGTNVFYVYAVDTNLNASLMIPVNIYNVTTPTTLSGLQARVELDGTDSFQIAFGKGTFSQVPSKNNVEGGGGVGTYTYTKGSDGASAVLNLKYTGPPSTASNATQSIALYFSDRTTAYFNFGSGYFYFSPAPKLAAASVINQFLISVGGGASEGYGTLFQSSIFTTYPLLTAGTNTGQYTYTLYSPMSALFKLTSTNSTDYIIANYGGTNYGSYYSEQYTPAGVTNGSDTGSFIFASQSPGGNAPLALTNRELQVFNGDGDFNVQFGTSTYSQDSASTNYDNAVGDYTYSLANTNIGQLNLTVVEPPDLAGNTNAARLIFVASNAGLFTNDDGTISAFAMTSVTNLVPASIANTTLSITEDSGGVDSIQFADDGTFLLEGVEDGTNTYTYTPFSPVGAMVRLNINSTNLTALDWVQLKFSATNSGKAFVKLFDTSTNQTDSFGGTFNLQSP